MFDGYIDSKNIHYIHPYIDRPSNRANGALPASYPCNNKHVLELIHVQVGIISFMLLVRLAHDLVCPSCLSPGKN